MQEHELAAMTAEHTHALLRSFAKANGVRNVGPALRIPRPGQDADSGRGGSAVKAVPHEVLMAMERAEEG